MERIITINSNELPKSVITKDILTDKLQKAGFTVCDEIHPETVHVAVPGCFFF